MPKVTRFDRERIAKLFGNKTKPIHKPFQTQNLHNKHNISPHKNIDIKQPPTSDKLERSSFKTISFIQMEKVYKVHNRPQQIQKIHFRCFNDEAVFGEEEMMNYLKQNYDNDHDTPQEQIKYDINRGVKKLKEELERRLLDNGEVQSEKALSVKGSVKGTPPGFVGIRISK